MVNLFQLLNKYLNSLNNPNQNYWESSTFEWNREAFAPNNEQINEEEIFQEIRNSDIRRLLKFG